MFEEAPARVMPRPGRASVILPLSSTTCPLTITYSMPTRGLRGIAGNAAVLNGRRIEDRQIGFPAGGDDAAVGDAELRGGAAGHLGDRLGQRDRAEAAHVAREHARERAVAARMASAQAAVRADQDERGS